MLQFETIIIGAGISGLYQLHKCRDELNLKTSIISYEINENPDYIDMRDEGIDVRLNNIFNHNYNKLVK